MPISPRKAETWVVVVVAERLRLDHGWSGGQPVVDFHARESEKLEYNSDEG